MLCVQAVLTFFLVTTSHAAGPAATQPVSLDSLRKSYSLSEGWKIIDDPDAPGHPVLFAGPRQRVDNLAALASLPESFTVRFRARFDTPFKGFPANDNVHFPHWRVDLDSGNAKGVEYFDNYVWNGQFLSADGNLGPAAQRVMQKLKWTDVQISHFRDDYDVTVDGQKIFSRQIPGHPAGKLGISVMDADLYLSDLHVEPFARPADFSPFVAVRPRTTGSVFLSGDGKPGIDLRVGNDDKVAHQCTIIWTIDRLLDGARRVGGHTDELQLPPGSNTDYAIDLPTADPGLYQLTISGSVQGREFLNQTSTLAIVRPVPAPVAGFRSKLGFNGDTSPELLERCGAAWVRTGAAFTDLTRGNDGAWNTQNARAQVAGFDKHPLLHTLDQYMNSGRGHTAGGITECAATFGEAATLFGDKLVYEIWNEPNHAGFWRLSPVDAEDFTALVKESTLAIRHAAPNATVASVSTSGAAPEFLHDMFAAGAGPYFDVVAYHPYGYPEIPETLLPKSLASMRNEIDSAGGWIDFHLSEQGYPTSEGGRGSLEPVQADLLLRSQLLFDNEPDVRAWHIYRFEDTGTNPRDVEARFGVVHIDLTPKPAFVALATYSAAAANSECVGRLPLTEGQFVQVYRRYDGKIVLAAWALQPTNVTVPVSSPATLWTGSGVQSPLPASGGTITLALTTSPQYVLLGDHEPGLLRAAAGQSLSRWAASVRAALTTAGRDPSEFDPIDRSTLALLSGSDLPTAERMASVSRALLALVRPSIETNLPADRFAAGTALADACSRYLGAISRAAMGPVPALADTSTPAADSKAAAGSDGTFVQASRIRRRGELEMAQARQLASIHSESAAGHAVVGNFLSDLQKLVASVEAPAYLESLFNVLPKNFTTSPGAWIDATLTFHNGDHEKRGVQIEVTPPASWKSEPQRISALVDAGGTWSQPLHLAVPAEVSGGHSVVTVVARSRGQVVQTYHLKVAVTAPVTMKLQPFDRLPGQTKSLAVSVASTTDSAFKGSIELIDTAGHASGFQPLNLAIRQEINVNFPLTLPLASPRNEYGITLRVSGGAAQTFSQKLPIDFTVTRVAAKPPVIDGKLDDWAEALPISIRAGQETVDEDKLSATAWTMIDATNLYVAVRVHDMVHNQENSADAMWNGDSIQISIDPTLARTENAYGPKDIEVGFALPAKGMKPMSHAWVTPRPDILDGARVAIVRDEATKTTTYEIAIATAKIPDLPTQPGSRFGLNIAVNDSDRNFGRDHMLEIVPGTSSAKNPAAYHAFTILAP